MILIQKIKNSALLKSSKISGLQIDILNDQQYHFNLIILKRKKQSVTVENKFSFHLLDELLQYNNSEIPIYISLDGKGVIHKKIINDTNDSKEKLVNKILPNSKIDDFFIQIFTLSDKEIYISIVRKDIIFELINQLKKYKLTILGISLGPFAVNTILTFFNPSQTISTDSYQITTKNSIVDSISKQNIPLQIYTIGNESISSQYLLSFASAFSYFIPIKYPLIYSESEEYESKQLFIKISWSILCIFLGILLINYLLFDHYNRKQAFLSNQLNQNKELFNKLGLLTKQLKENEKFITDNNLAKSSRFSYYSDRLVLLLPPSIKLSKLDIQPLYKKIKSANSIEIKKNIISIIGNVQNGLILNEWIKKIKNENWVKEVIIISYKQENINTSGEFNIEITIL